MVSMTARNAAKLIERNGSSLPVAKPATRKAPRKAVAKGNDIVAASNEAPAEVVAPSNNPAAPTPVACNCGCGAMANLGRAYKPGHDARHAGLVGRALVAKAPGAEAARDALPPALRAKAERFADNAAKAEARKTAAAAIRTAAKAALAAELAAL